MAGNSRQIKGITVEIDGKTTKLNDALKETNRAAKSTQQELNQINRQLKYDPTNVTLIAQKHEILGKRVEEVKGRLNTLKTAQNQFDQELLKTDEGAAQYRALQREIIKTEGTLQHLETEYQKVDDAAEGPLNEVKNKTQEVGETTEQQSTSIAVAIGNLISSAVQTGISKLKDLAIQAVETGSSFETSMAKVASLSGATGQDLENLTSAAREYGATTQFSATEAADALGYMALAGWDAHDSIDALPGVLDLAAASSMDLAQASDMVTDYLSAFGLSSKDATKFADEMAYAQANSNTTTEQLGEAFRNCAANMHASGQDVETTTSLLATLANQGLKGSEAGTALSAVMRDLTSHMKDGAIQIGDTAVQVVDANGNYRDMSDILKDVETATAGMGTAQRATALQSTFTSDSIKGLNLILSGGVDETNDFEAALRKSDGTAKKTAKTMNDNLKGDVKELSSAFEELQIRLYKKVEPALRTVTQSMTGLFTEMAKGEGSASELSAVLIPLAGAMAGVAVEAKGLAVLSGVGKLFTGLGGVLSGNIVGLAIGLLAGLIIYLIQAYNTNKKFRESIDSVIDGFKGFVLAIGQFIAGIGGFIQSIYTASVNFTNSMNTFLNNLYFSIANVITNITNVIQGIITFIASIPSTIWGFLSAIINFCISFYTTIFQYLMMLLQAVGSIFGSLWSYASGGVMALINNTISFFINLYNSGANALNSLLGYVGSWAGSLWSYASGGVSSFVSSVWSTFSGGIGKLGSSMYRWGADMIDGLVRGLRAGIRHVRQAASNLADTIRSYLHFSRPDIGPLRDYESWMPDMVHGLAESMQKALPELDAAAGQLGSHIQLGVVAPSTTAGKSIPTYQVGDIKITINTQPGQNAKEIAREVQRLVVHDIQRKI